MDPFPEKLYFNGVSAASGRYFRAAMSPSRLAVALDGDPPTRRTPRGVEAWLEPRDLAAAGWGVVFPQNVDPAIREALAPLLEHRRAQAGRKDERCYRELTCLPGENKRRFLPRHGAGPGPVDPHKVPYYLLLVGGPGEIPFHLQYGLDVQYAVGRLAFDTPEEYACYAESVVAWERHGGRRNRRAAFFGVRNPDDEPTRLSIEHLVGPLLRKLKKTSSIDQPGDEGPVPLLPGWEIRSVLAGEATKDRLSRLLGGDETPALLFTAGHAVLFPKDHPRQVRRQGGLLCADWPGPEAWRGPVPDDHYFSGPDVAPDADLHGLVSFHFACFSAATPRFDSFDRAAPEERRAIASDPFMARLPQRLLAHPRGGALAVVGHVDRAWEHSFLWDEAGSQVGVFASALRKLLDGDPVGFALEDFGLRYAEISTELHDLELEGRATGEPVDDATRLRLWTAFHDARSYVVLGDPAVRLDGPRHDGPPHDGPRHDGPPHGGPSHDPEGVR